MESKRVYGIYCELELNQRIKPRKRLKRAKPDKLAVPEALNQTWSMDFISDNLSDGHPLRTFNVIDDNRECLTIDVGLSLPSERVIRALEKSSSDEANPKLSAAITALSTLVKNCWTERVKKQYTSTISS